MVIQKAIFLNPGMMQSPMTKVVTKIPYYWINRSLHKIWTQQKAVKEYSLSPLQCKYSSIKKKLLKRNIFYLKKN